MRERPGPKAPRQIEDLKVLTPEETLDDAVELMRKHAIRRIAIERDGQPVGILSIGDLAAVLDPDSALGELSRTPANR